MFSALNMIFYFTQARIFESTLILLSSKYGDLSKGCLNSGRHFNPTNKNHGDPATPGDRHVGDLGNLPANGTVDFSFDTISLVGDNSIMG
jgi:Cu-Zn family superoxide dismutase